MATYAVFGQKVGSGGGSSTTTPGIPTIGTASVASATTASVTFTAPTNDGGAPITSYTVTSTPGGITATGIASPIVVTGLTSGTAYTFKVKATNVNGDGPESLASNSVTPVLPQSFAAVHTNSPYITAYPFFNIGTGFGAKFANPVTIPFGDGRAVSFSPAGDYIAVASSLSPFITVYPWSTTSGFGTKFSDPAVLPTGIARAVSFSPSGDAIVVGHNNSPFVTAYSWSSGGFGAKYSDPATALTSFVTDVTFSQSGSSIAMSSSSGNNVYRWSGSGFGAKYSDPQQTLGGNQAVAFSPSEDSIAYALTNSPYIRIYRWSSQNGFGGTYSDSTVFVPNTGTGAEFSPSGNSFVLSHNVSPFLSAWQWSSATGFGSQFGGTSPAVAVSNPTGVAFNQSGNAVVVSGTASPYLNAYSFADASGFGAKFSDPSILPTGSVYGIAFGATPAAPYPPTGVYASPTSPTSAGVRFDPGSFNGSPITSYTVTSSPGGLTGTGANSPITVSGLTAGGTYTFTVTATNAIGTSSTSLASNSVTLLPERTAIAVAGTASVPDVYPWSTSGFGTRYSNPGTVPAGTINAGVVFSPAGDAIAFVSTSSPFINVYAWNSTTGFGTKFANPAILPAGQGRQVAFSPSGDAIAVAHDSFPFITAYAWNSTTGFGSKFANPAIALPGNGGVVTFSPAGDAIAIGHGAIAPSNIALSVYRWSGSGFGTRYTDFVTPPSIMNCIAFSPSANAIAIGGSGGNPGIYRWSSSGFGTKYVLDFTSWQIGATGVQFSPFGDSIAESVGGSPYILAWDWYPNTSIGLGAQLIDPTVLPAGTARGLAFSTYAIAVAHSTSPFITVYPWSTATGFGVKFSNPATLPSFGQAVAFCP